MNKNEFVNRLAQKGYTKKAANVVVTDMLLTITEALIEGETISLNGFGTFSVRDSAERQSYNVQTKEKCTIPGHKTPRFIAGNVLKRAVREGLIRE